MHFADRFIAATTKWVGSAILILMALQIVIDVAMRNLLGAGFPATAEIVSKYYMLAVSFLPIAYAELQRRHVEASIFTDMMPRKTHGVIYALGFALSLIVYCLLAWGTGKEALHQTKRGAYVEAGAMDFYTWPGTWILPFCFGLMAIVVALRLIELLSGKFRDAPADTAIITDPIEKDN
ncbi:TRAP transporter small permease [Thalassobius sp. S69A]|uniref:TRAP transporter small permease n=1 Tax=unclassified Thalassovita TaxID=2619711 RepID=UPI000C0E0124|nr:C4-dicarboxylate ABC transporter [Paracoccaceae bacterium]MBT26937.1 C4-dicarboxylate ABC transporter [Paracoccaceae bacterium]